MAFVRKEKMQASVPKKCFIRHRLRVWIKFIQSAQSDFYCVKDTHKVLKFVMIYETQLPYVVD